MDAKPTTGQVTDSMIIARAYRLNDEGRRRGLRVWGFEPLALNFAALQEHLDTALDPGCLQPGKVEFPCSLLPVCVDLYKLAAQSLLGERALAFPI